MITAHLEVDKRARWLYAEKQRVGTFIRPVVCIFTSLPLSGSTGFVLVRVDLMGHGQLVPPQRYSDNVSLA